jgi:L-2-hydroxyglutarate oxidase LhgO
LTDEQVAAVVIGGGVVGCALAQRLAAKHLPPIILEAGPRIGEGVTSRNSGVIHAGLYYPPSSLKAQTCIPGQILLKQWCTKHNVPWRETGKWIVAPKDSIGSLDDLMANALASGAIGLCRKSKIDIEREFQGVVIGEDAVFSAATGIVDPYAFSLSLLASAQENGAELLTNCHVQAIEFIPSGGYRVFTSRGTIDTERIFNSAGLYADEIARMVGIDRYRIHPWRGDYFRINTDFGIKSLVYPVRRKDAPGLGVHLTIELDGRCKLGPDVEFVECKNDFAPRENKLESFLVAAHQYLPHLQSHHLVYDTCGIRPKLRSPNDKTERDFIVSQDKTDFINLIGIESPGLTAAMALAKIATDL